MVEMIFIVLWFSSVVSPDCLDIVDDLRWRFWNGRTCTSAALIYSLSREPDTTEEPQRTRTLSRTGIPNAMYAYPLKLNITKFPSSLQGYVGANFAFFHWAVSKKKVHSLRTSVLDPNPSSSRKISTFIESRTPRSDVVLYEYTNLMSVLSEGLHFRATLVKKSFILCKGAMPHPSSSWH